MILSQQLIKEEVARCLNEDIGSGDVSAHLLPEGLEITAEIISREPMIVCGQPWVNATFGCLDPQIKITWMVAEGQWLDKPATLCQIYGNARHILTAERTALNFFQTLSATATQTGCYLEKLAPYQTQLLDTRKTLPGLRMAQKYAVSCAGGMNHRLGLYDAYLIKENHIKACGSITKAIQLARAKSAELFLEIEVENLVELEEALQAKPDRILLDNFTLPMLNEAVKMNAKYHCQLEASGGIDLSNIDKIAATGVDYISVGSITKSIQAIDLSLLIRD